MVRRFAGSTGSPLFIVVVCMVLVGCASRGLPRAKPGGDSLIHEIVALNSEFKDNEASFTSDGRTVYFACYGRFGRNPALGDICVSHLTGAFEDMRWSEPELVPYPITTDFSEQEPKISMDGQRLYFQSSRPGGKGGADVWVSERGPSGEWQEPVNLPYPINTAFDDHCFYFEDPITEDAAYMASNRPGTLGGNDLWYTRKIDGVWTEPANLGPNINGPGNDHMAMLGPDGRLWVTTNRVGSLGGEDQWVSERDANGNWGPLRNLGAPFNTLSDDRCGDWNVFTDHGQKTQRFFVFSSSRLEAPTNPSGAGNLNNYYVPFDVLLKSLGFPSM